MDRKKKSKRNINRIKQQAITLIEADKTVYNRTLDVPTAYSRLVEAEIIKPLPLETTITSSAMGAICAALTDDFPSLIYCYKAATTFGSTGTEEIVYGSKSISEAFQKKNKIRGEWLKEVIYDLTGYDIDYIKLRYPEKSILDVN